MERVGPMSLTPAGCASLNRGALKALPKGVELPKVVQGLRTSAVAAVVALGTRLVTPARSYVRCTMTGAEWIPGQQDDREFASEEEYLKSLEAQQALPKGRILRAKDLAAEPGALAAAQGIMTTDRYPKLCCRELPNGARLVGIAKGAGMIEPNMATMLCFLMTDANVPRNELQRLLSSTASSSFNAISVDGDESTSDTAAWALRAGGRLVTWVKVVLISSGHVDAVPLDAFAAALRDVCGDLAAQIVRNGEGTQHVIRVAVSGAPSDHVARKAGGVAGVGNDPNVGRLIGKVGQTLGALDASALAEGCTCKIGAAGRGETIFEDGQFRLDTEKERRLSDHLKFAAAQSPLAALRVWGREVHGDLPYPEHRRVVDVEVILGGGGSGFAVASRSQLAVTWEHPWRACHGGEEVVG
eukprot:Skav201761  [mRNA]  locus=scaffold1973:346110:356866:- [translate_table: standard]